MSHHESQAANADRSAPATGADALVIKHSPRSVPDTLARLRSLIAEKGMKLFAAIDHSGEAQHAGLRLRDTKVVIFGSPQAGTPVMQAAPLIALELPLKVLIFSDTPQTKVVYTDPRALAARYGLAEELAARLVGIDGLTDALVSP